MENGVVLPLVFEQERRRGAQVRGLRGFPGVPLFPDLRGQRISRMLGRRDFGERIMTRARLVTEGVAGCAGCQLV